jgi:hypothetical protein
MKMKVEIIEIREEKADVLLLVRCCRPHQKDTPFSKGREELDKNNELFKENAERYRQEMKEFRKRTLLLHLGHALLIQDERGEL